MLKIILALVASMLVYSCTKDNNPLTSGQVSDYIGEAGTQRTYKTTERWLVPGTDQPYYTVPDSLMSSVSLDTNQLRSGLCIIENCVEAVSSITDDYYTSWHLSSPRESYLQIGSTTNGTLYSLPDEIKALAEGRSYSPTGWGSGENIFRHTADAIMTVTTTDLALQFPSVPYLKNSLSVGNTWTRYEFIDTTTAKPIIQTIATVVDQMSVTVPAGTYYAYRVHLQTYHYDPDYDFDEGYEYWVPNVGLVLKESDMELFQWNSSNNQTISYRQIERQELISVNFVH